MSSSIPKASTLKQLQDKSLTSMKRCRCPMEALPTQSSSPLIQCSSFSGRLHAIMNIALLTPRAAVSASIPGCTIAPLATRANTLNGFVPVVSSPSLTNPKPSSSVRRAGAPPSWRRRARTAANEGASATFGNSWYSESLMAVSAAFSDAATAFATASDTTACASASITASATTSSTSTSAK